MTNTLPFSFIDGVQESTNGLHAAVFSGKFPDLSDDPESDADVVTVMDAAREWARGVSEAYGVQATRESGYKFEEPRPLLAWFSTGSVQAAPGSSRPSLVATALGDIPEQFWKCRADAFLQCFGGMGQPERTFTPEHAGHLNYGYTLGTWPELRENLERHHLLVVVQSMQLVALVRERIKCLEQALIPEIRRVQVLVRSRVELEIRMAGVVRTVEIPNAAAEFLDELGMEGTAKARRPTKLELVRVIPELDIWIKGPAKRPRGAQTSENEGWYYMADAARKGIKSPIAAKWNEEGTVGDER